MKEAQLIQYDSRYLTHTPTTNPSHQPSRHHYSVADSSPFVSYTNKSDFPSPMTAKPFVLTPTGCGAWTEHGNYQPKRYRSMESTTGYSTMPSSAASSASELCMSSWIEEQELVSPAVGSRGGGGQRSFSSPEDAAQVIEYSSIVLN